MEYDRRKKGFPGEPIGKGERHRPCLARFRTAAMLSAPVGGRGRRPAAAGSRNGIVFIFLKNIYLFLIFIFIFV